MTTEKQKAKEPVKVRNLADLKRLIKPGTEIMAISHKTHPEIVGLVRIVTKVQTNAFYSVIKDQPNHRYSTCNYGEGFRSDFEKAGNYVFSGSAIQVLDARVKDGSVLYELEVYGTENTMGIQEKEKSNMNEFDRLRHTAQRNQELYPAGTRIMLLQMGDNPRPVEPNTRGTVQSVDDIGTRHCIFDNGRHLGLVPGEDSYRRLTEHELAEEQGETADENNTPEMRM